jgi:lysophospholipase L1-like esterase
MYGPENQSKCRGDLLKRLVFILIFLVCLYFLVNSVKLGVRIHKGIKLSEESSAYEVNDHKASKRILIVGDSTGVGTGADDPSDSIAGRIADEFPFVEIINKSADGARASDVLEQLNSLEDTGFDIVLVQFGGNDILRFTDLDTLKRAVAEILQRAYQAAPKVIFMSTGNVGSSPAFFSPISWIYTDRTRKVRSIFLLLSREKGVEYVDLFREKSEDPFLNDPKRYFAPDLLHPGSDGYLLWYEELKSQTSLSSILRGRGVQ